MHSRERWYAVRTKARQESVAQVNLERQEFKAYLPTIRVAKRRARKWDGAVEPLFPGYLFVQVDTAVKSTAPIANTRGAIGLVRFGGELCPVPHGVVERIKSMQADRDAPIEPAEVFKPGDAVTIVDGPFAGVSAIVHAQDGQERVSLLLELMGRSNRVEMCAHQVVPV